jgi:hypothetical protein
MKSRPTTFDLRTIQFHRGNPESPGVKKIDEGEARKDAVNQKPVEGNNFFNEDTINTNSSLERNETIE